MCSSERINSRVTAGQLTLFNSGTLPTIMSNKFQPNLFTLTSIFENLEDAIFTHDVNFNIIQLNLPAETMFGLEAGSSLGKSIFITIPEQLHGQYQALFAEVLRDKRIRHFNTTGITSTGKEFPVALTMSAVKDADGNVIGASQILRDITFEKDAEAKHAILSSIIETSDDAIISKTLDGIITSWNAGAERIFGYTSGEAIGKSITILIPEEKLPEEDYILSNIKKGIRIQHFQTTRVSKEGTEIPISLTVSPVKDSSGLVIGVSKIARNITAEKLASERQARLAAIVESSDDAIISKTLEGIITSWNTGAEKIFGYKETEVLGKHISILIPHDRLEEETEIISSIKRGEKVDHFQTIRKTRDARELHISLTVSPIKDEDGNIIGASKVARDITAEKNAEETLTRNNQQLRILNNVSTTILEDLDRQAILQKVTDATTQITGAEFGAFIYNALAESGEAMMLYTLSGADREDFDKFGMPGMTAIFHPTLSGQGVMRSDDITKDPRFGLNDSYFGMPEGHLPVVSYLSVPVKTNKGEVIGGLFFGHSLPGRFLQEHEDLIINLAAQAAIALDNSRLFQEVTDLSRKKDEFIALASHELRTPLTSLSGFMQMVGKAVADGTGKVLVGKSLQILDKLNRLINDLFDISKIQSGKLEFNFENVDLAGILNEVVESSRVAHPTHRIDLDIDESALISGDKMRLEQVLINLINNAVKYSPGADKVDVKMRKQSGLAIVYIKDYGIGINETDQTDIFSQFYRAEGVNNKISGLGLGLFITREIIERHQGQISVTSKLGEGAVFQFTIPTLHDSHD